MSEKLAEQLTFGSVGGLLGFLVGGPAGAIAGFGEGYSIGTSIYGATNPDSNLPAGTSATDVSTAQGYGNTPSTALPTTGTSTAGSESLSAQEEAAREKASTISIENQQASYNQQLEKLATGEAMTESGMRAGYAQRGIKLEGSAYAQLSVQQQLGAQAQEEATKQATGTLTAAQLQRQAGITKYQKTILQEGQKAANASANDWLTALDTSLGFGADLLKNAPLPTKTYNPTQEGNPGYDYGYYQTGYNP